MKMGMKGNNVVLGLLIIVVVSGLLVGNMTPLYVLGAVCGILFYYLAQAISLLAHKPRLADINTGLVIGTGLFALSLLHFFPAMVSGYEFTSDAGGEIGIYQGILREGWGYRGENAPWMDPTSLLHSAFTTTRLPAILQPITGIEPVLWYRIWLAFVMSLAPVGLFLMARQVTKSSLLALAVVSMWMSQFYFYDGFSFARTIAGVGCYFLLVRFMVDPRRSYWWLVVVSAALIVTYYGAATIAVLAVGATFVGTLLFDRLNWRRVTFTLLCLIVATTVYHQWQDRPVISATHVGEQAAVEATGGEGNPWGADQVTTKVSKWDTREEVVQQAFGKGLAESDLDYKINFAVNWIEILTINVLLYIRFIRKRSTITLLGLSHAALLVLAVILPTLSLTWGIVRYWFISSPIMLTAGLERE